MLPTKKLCLIIIGPLRGPVPLLLVRRLRVATPAVIIDLYQKNAQKSDIPFHNVTIIAK
jgi:hypothetical protein